MSAAQNETVVGVDLAAEGGDWTAGTVGGPDAVRVAGLVFDGKNDPFPVCSEPSSLPVGWTFLPATDVHYGAVDQDTGAQNVTVDVMFPDQLDKIFMKISLADDS